VIAGAAKAGARVAARAVGRALAGQECPGPVRAAGTLQGLVERDAGASLGGAEAAARDVGGFIDTTRQRQNQAQTPSDVRIEPRAPLELLQGCQRRVVPAGEGQ
jgi:hypothetical protein